MQHKLLEIFQIHNHIPQVIILIVGINNIGKSSKAQLWAHAEDMITDCMALWTKAYPDPQIRLGLFVSLIPPYLWYPSFLGQQASRDSCRLLNSHISKITKMLQVVVIPHLYLTAEEWWFHDPHNDPVCLSEPGYDLFLLDVCLAVAAKLQFSAIW